jgi:hypothetical protein
VAAMSSQAQTNLQVHYDFGENRQFVTTTLEMFKPDKWGNTFFFVDMDFNYGEKNSPSCAYMEIARDLNFWGGPFGAHIEYNGGLGGYNTLTPYEGGSYAINSAWLLGVDYNMHNTDFSRTLTLQAMYKNIVGKNTTPQFTAVWGLHFLNRKVSFTGFADLWWEKYTYTAAGTDANPVFITEPQLWYNFTENLSAGSEVELSTNFGGNEGFMVNPTLAVKWNF